MNNALENQTFLKYEEFEDYEIKDNFQTIPNLTNSFSQSMNLSGLFLPSNSTMPEKMSDANITFTPLNIQEENLVKNLLSIFPDWSEFPTSGIPLVRQILLILVASALALGLASFCLKNCFCRKMDKDKEAPATEATKAIESKVNFTKTFTLNNLQPSPPDTLCVLEIEEERFENIQKELIRPLQVRW